MRRQTLGNLDVNRMPQTPGSALSEAAAGRRMTIMTPKPRTEDHRQDPAWRKEKAQSMLDFLHRHGWSTQQLPDLHALCHCPTHGQVLAILQFLFRLADHTLALASLDADKVTTIFKRGLQYPTNLPAAKKVLQITPLTWHTMLAAIVWLAEKLDAGERLRSTYSQSPPAAGGADTGLFHSWAAKGYKFAVQGCDDWVRVEQEFVLNIDRQRRDTLHEVAMLQATRDAVRRRRADGRAQLEAREASRHRADTFARDLQSYEIFLERKAEHNDGKAVAAAEGERGMGEWTREIESLERQRSAVHQALQAQELTKDDVERLEREKLRLHTQIVEQSVRAKATAREVETIEAQVHREVDALCTRIAELNNAAALLLVFPGGKHMYPGETLRVVRDLAGCATIQDLQLLAPAPRMISGNLDALLQRYRGKKQAMIEAQRALRMEMQCRESALKEQVAEADALAHEIDWMAAACSAASDHRNSLTRLHEELLANRARYDRNTQQYATDISAGLTQVMRRRDAMEAILAGVEMEMAARLAAAGIVMSDDEDDDDDLS